MIIRFFARGREGKGAVEYIMNSKLHKGLKVMRGDPMFTKEIIKSLNYSHRYTSGVLAFEESNIDDDILNSVINGFEQVMFPGLNHEEFNICIVKHTEKSKTELHFIVPNTNLLLNRVFKPYFHKSDLALFDSFKELINLKYKFSDPNSKEKQNTLKKSHGAERALLRLKREDGSLHAKSNTTSLKKRRMR